jgi:hypothetical protein
VLIAAFIILAAAGAAGVLLIALHFTRMRIPRGLAPGHGLAALSGLTLIVIQALRGGASGTVHATLAFLGIAALGGALIFSQHVRKRRLSLEVMGVHAVVAAVGILALLVAIAGPHT